MLWGIPALLIVAGALYATNAGRSAEDSSLPTDQPIFEVVKGPLTISATESGTIKAREQEILKNEMEGRTTILTLVPEGTEVKKGDLLIELDASSLVDNRVDQMIQVQNAEAAFTQASETFAVVENQAASDVDLASLTLFFAQEDFNNYKRGEFPKLLKEADSKITLASSELLKASDELHWARILYDEKFLSQTKLQEHQIAVQNSTHEFQLALADKNLLTDFTYGRNVKQLNSDVKQSEMALERAHRKARADIIEASASLKAKEAEFLSQTNKLKKLDEQIAKAKIYAPMDGLVIYATSARASWRGNDEPLDEGQEIRERQELIYLPTTDSVKAELKLHESNLDKVSEGLPVRVTVDAVPGKSYTGTVAKISPLPDAQSIYMNPDLKVYATEVFLSGAAGELKTGMSCRAEILVDYFPDATYVPIQSIVRVKGEPTVFVYNGTVFEPRIVEPGLDNNRMIHIKGGLEPGEKVLLTPPLELGEIREGEAGSGLSEEESSLLESAGADSQSAPQESTDVSPREDWEPAVESEETLRDGAGENSEGEGRRNRRRAEGDEGGEGDERRRARAGEGNHDREALRRQFESMTPEQQEQMRSQWRNRQGGQRPAQESGAPGS
jgi:HlyD family secretion protein